MPPAIRKPRWTVEVFRQVDLRFRSQNRCEKAFPIRMETETAIGEFAHNPTEVDGWEDSQIGYLRLSSACKINA